MRHPRHELADLLTHSVRFSIVALLASASRADFSFVRDQVEVSDSVLSRQVSALEEAGIVRVHKGFVGRRPHTWLSLSAGGRRTYERHLAALRSIVEGEWPADAAVTPEVSGPSSAADASRRKREPPPRRPPTRRPDPAPHR